ncbi:MAG: preprotein translocase subunit YajC [Burkholderiales bacterium]|nr:preprotein translocase subunit YajC [Burkholderiales bacterium]
MFISDAYAQPAAGLGGDFMGLLPIIVMFVLLYFLMIRPQMKRAKEHRTMLEGLQKGDEVIAAGLLGKIVKVGDSFVTVEIADNVTVAVQKPAVSQLLPKGTVKSSQ